MTLIEDSVKADAGRGSSPHYALFPIVEYGAGEWALSPLALERSGPEWAPGSSLVLRTRLSAAQPLRVRGALLFCDGKLLRMKTFESSIGCAPGDSLEFEWKLTWYE